MTEKVQWPAEVERKRPRVAETAGLGLLLGGGIGALVGAGLGGSEHDVAERAAIGAAGGALVGVLASAGVGSIALSLERSLRIALQKLGATFVSLRRNGRHRAELVFKTSKGYKAVQVVADSNRDWNADELDDWLYAELVLKAYNMEGQQ